MPIAKLIPGYRRSEKPDSTTLVGVEPSDEVSQQPGVLWIGCSDSRVIPEHIANVGPGEIFVIRNVANIVPPYGTADETVGAAIEYAVIDLRVPHIVICGHTDCGGIKALDKSIDMARRPYLARWLEWARPARNQVVVAGITGSDRHQEMVRANILLQTENLRSYPCVRDAQNNGHLNLHAWMYDLKSGELSRYDASSSLWEVVIV